jgi:hypothetical protein
MNAVRNGVLLGVVILDLLGVATYTALKTTSVADTKMVLLLCNLAASRMRPRVFVRVQVELANSHGCFPAYISLL